MKPDSVLYEGKAKQICRSDTPGELMMRFKDDITAFDGKKHDVLEGKGRYNAQVSSFFFEYLEGRGIETHYIRMETPTVMVVREMEMIPLEVVVRNVAAGSMVRDYPVEEGTPLDPPVIFLHYKDDSRHDPMINDEVIITLGILPPEELDILKETALAVNMHLSAYLDECGITLVDLKMEFGRSDSTIYLADEISMDSMRLWDKKTGKSLDKDLYRFDKGDVIAGYATVVGRIAPEIPGGGR